MINDKIMTTLGMVDDDIIAESINAKAAPKNAVWLRLGIAASCAACVLGAAGIGAYAYYTPASYVSLDVNPSIEYSLNTFNRVLSATGVNDDGENILDDIGSVRLKNQSIDRAIRETINAIAQRGYFPLDDEGGVVIAVYDKQLQKAEKLSEKLKEAVEQVAQEESLDVDVESMAVGEERVQEARSLGVTPGKLNLVEKLQASAQNIDDIDVEEWLNKSVKEIMKETKANKALNKGKSSKIDNGADKDLDEDSDVTLDSGEASKAEKGNSANKPDKAADKADKQADKDADKANNSGNGSSADKPQNGVKKNDDPAASDNNNGSNKSDSATNKGQSKKLYAAIDSNAADTAGAAEADSEKGKSTEKTNKSDKPGKNKSK